MNTIPVFGQTSQNRQISRSQSEGESPLGKVRERFGEPTGPTTVVDLTGGTDGLSSREQEIARDGQKVYRKITDFMSGLERADNNSPLDVNPQEGHYESTPSPRPVPTFTTNTRWSETQGGAQRHIVPGSIQDEGTVAVTTPGERKMASASTYTEEGARPIPGGMYYLEQGDVEKMGLCDQQGKRIEVVVSKGHLLTVMESFNPRS